MKLIKWSSNSKIISSSTIAWTTLVKWKICNLFKHKRTLRPSASEVAVLNMNLLGYGMRMQTILCEYLKANLLSVSQNWNTRSGFLKTCITESTDTFAASCKHPITHSYQLSQFLCVRVYLWQWWKVILQIEDNPSPACVYLVHTHLPTHSPHSYLQTFKEEVPLSCKLCKPVLLHCPLADGFSGV